MHSRLLQRPVLLTTFALLAVASFGAAPALADRDDHRGPGHGYHRHHDHRHSHGHSHSHSGFGIRVVIGSHGHAPHPGHGPHCRYIPAHCQTRTETVCVAPARIERRWCEPRYEVRFDSCGRRFSVCVSTGHWEHVHIPARYETRTYQVQIPARWVCSDGCGYAHATGHSRY